MVKIIFFRHLNLKNCKTSNSLYRKKSIDKISKLHIIQASNTMRTNCMKLVKINIPNGKGKHNETI